MYPKVESLKPLNDLRYQHYLTGKNEFVPQFFILKLWFTINVEQIRFCPILEYAFKNADLRPLQ